MTYPAAEKIKELIGKNDKIVIVQADNPDADSLASSLALEQILGDLGKKTYMYCGVDIPAYLRHLPGWDRVSKDLPSQFDLSIIVDTSSISLFEQLSKSDQKNWLASKPCVIIDHHATAPSISFATVTCIQEAVATGEIIYELASQLKWSLNETAKNMVASAILSDSMGLTSQATTARSIHIIGELVEGGVSIAKLENLRRELMRKSPSILKYKGRLLERVEYSPDGRIATVTIPWREIEEYSPEYNPSMLVIEEMRMVENVDVAIAFKAYEDGKITAKIRCNYGKTIAKDLAEHFGGGGHPYASGFKITDGRPLDLVKSDCLAHATELLDKIETKNHEAI